MKLKHKLHGLYVITNHDHLGTDQLLADATLCLRAGARVLQYRDKSQDPVKRLEQAKQLLQLSEAHQAVFIINDDVELTLESGAHGVHLGKHDQELQQARKLLGQDRLIGVSCYNQLSLAVEAEEQGADYVAFGRFFPSRSKPDAVQANSELLSEAKQVLTLPIVAIGGITPENAGQLIDAGADMLAVIDAVFGQPDIASASRFFAKLFNH